MCTCIFNRILTCAAYIIAILFLTFGTVFIVDNISTVSRSRPACQHFPFALRCKQMSLKNCSNECDDTELFSLYTKRSWWFHVIMQTVLGADDQKISSEVNKAKQQHLRKYLLHSGYFFKDVTMMFQMFKTLKTYVKNTITIYFSLLTLFTVAASVVLWTITNVPYSVSLEAKNRVQVYIAKRELRGGIHILCFIYLRGVFEWVYGVWLLAFRCCF